MEGFDTLGDNAYSQGSSERRHSPDNGPLFDVVALYNRQRLVNLDLVEWKAGELS